MSRHWFAPGFQGRGAAGGEDAGLPGHRVPTAMRLEELVRGVG